MQIVEIILFVLDELFYGLTAFWKNHYQLLRSGTAQRNIW